MEAKIQLSKRIKKNNFGSKNFKNMKIAALLTGKGSSTLKNKNLLKINNKPILYYPCAEAKKIKDIDKFFVSSEDKKILDICNKYGYEKILRPKNLSKANSKHHDVILHSVKYMKNKNYHPDILIILLANAPIISSKWIKDCLKILRNNKKTTSVVPVILNNDHNPFRAKKLRGNYLKNFYKIKKKVSSNRQDLPNSYFLCHNFWVIRTKEIYKFKGEPPWNFMGKHVQPYIVKKSIDIHTIEDLHLSKLIINNKSYL